MKSMPARRGLWYSLGTGRTKCKGSYCRTLSVADTLPACARPHVTTGLKTASQGCITGLAAGTNVRAQMRAQMRAKAAQALGSAGMLQAHTGSQQDHSSMLQGTQCSRSSASYLKGQDQTGQEAAGRDQTDGRQKAAGHVVRLQTQTRAVRQSCAYACRPWLWPCGLWWCA